MKVVVFRNFNIYCLRDSSLISFHGVLHACLKSILRQANFKGAKLLGASFFDADLTGG